MNEELAYSFHLGSDKNKSKLAKKVAKGNVSGTIVVISKIYYSCPKCYSLVYQSNVFTGHGSTILVGYGAAF